MKDDFEMWQDKVERVDLIELSSNARYEFAISYWKAKSSLTRHMDAFMKSHIADANSTAFPAYQDNINFPSQLNKRNSRLPELHLPRFSCSYEDWPDFIAMYNSVVGNNEDLSTAEKFQHLRACLDGAALNTIKSLEPADANYDKALELLTKRFDNKLLHFQGHVRDIFGLVNVEKGSSEALRGLSDKIN
ncbi:uncharacterized protein LOC123037678 [Drosophila rhopaloa]|uniref:Uncharacterized protein n=1 Tax=Drosophila rhopaloa TaxID=1041015 RepID=A0ABM5J904_DRORH|nr:uncharacterized protein LOC123037677 [Drosophila rhopaloa]XP_044315300.1 uncharacterized protein LOC123037678 [Drosophila rhopaloa]